LTIAEVGGEDAIDAALIWIVILGCSVAILAAWWKYLGTLQARKDLKETARASEARGRPPQRSRRSSMNKSGIFISYRRQDEPNFAGRLYDRLVAQFGRSNVFIDVDTIELGLDFAEVIDKSLSQCKVMIVVIGKQ
jgi:TIR domain